MASRLGDQTARMLGRVSLNPMDHVDPIGTLLLPGLMIFGPLFGLGMFGGFLFGWAKPVPIISRNFRNFKRDDMLVSLAGPASNLLLALIAFLGLAAVLLSVSHLPEGVSPSTTQQSLEMLCNTGHAAQPHPVHLQPAAHSAAGWQPCSQERSALWRGASLRQHYRVAQLSAPHLCGPFVLGIVMTRS